MLRGFDAAERQFQHEPKFPNLGVPRIRPWQARPAGPNWQERDLRLCGSMVG